MAVYCYGAGWKYDIKVDGVRIQRGGYADRNEAIAASDEYRASGTRSSCT